MISTINSAHFLSISKPIHPSISNFLPTSQPSLSPSIALPQTSITILFTICRMINTTEVCANYGKTVDTKLKRDKCPHYGTTKCKQDNVYVTKKVSTSNCVKCSKDGKSGKK
ncbi:hypothetical protein FCOIX_3600 [Fusarium coicis]|nr:hypothetical protein FCOIX_3600 [Fusarium coicis]